SPSFVDAPPTTEIYPLSLHDALPISRCEARSQPFATGTGWLCCPSSNTSLPSGPMLRSVANTSMSSVVDDTHSTSTTGPVTSMSSLSGAVWNDTPSCGTAPGSTVDVHEAEATPALLIPLAE